MDHLVAELLDENKRRSAMNPVDNARYTSLTGPLLGLYYRLPQELGTDESVLRIALNSSKLRDLWCAIYTWDEVAANISQFGGQFIDIPNQLDYDTCQVYEAMKSPKK